MTEVAVEMPAQAAEIRGTLLHIAEKSRLPGADRIRRIRFPIRVAITYKEQSAAVQCALFLAGYAWAGGSRSVFTDYPMCGIVAKPNGQIYFMVPSEKDVFDSLSYRAMTLDEIELMATAAEA